jgi:hypothetical protein
MIRDGDAGGKWRGRRIAPPAREDASERGGR